MRNRLAHYARGAAMAEMAVVVSFTLLLIFGMLQVELVSYIQTTGDAAVFEAAHQYTLGVQPSAIASAVSSIAPNELASSLTYTPQPPNPVGSTLFNSIYGTLASNNRSNGYTLVRPQNFTAYLKSASYNGILGFTNLPIDSAAVEGYYLMSNDVMNNFGTSPDDPTALGGNILNGTYASPFLQASNTTAENMNTPPYYLPTPDMEFCSNPWIYQNTGAADENFGLQCTTNRNQLDFLGIGEYLENTNYTASAMGTDVGDAFQAMAAHQRIYANLIQAFPSMTGVTCTYTGAATPNTEDDCFQIIQTQFQDYNDNSTTTSPGTGLTPGNTDSNCHGTTGCGMNWSNIADFPNQGTGSTAVPLCYYDPLLWEIYEGTANWAPKKLWTSEAAGVTNCPSADAGNDGPAGPAGWGLASPALVYYWDQPNFPAAAQAPGSYPTNPLAGAEVVGDPAY